VTSSPRVVVFLGPTLGLDDARRELDAVYVGPAAQGDVLRVVESAQPAAIAIIDGYFASVPTVWHKEILWALAQGVRVYGASSMGALRAAELEPFGMVGVGRIFERFRSGEYEDDDEVTVVHGPADAGYRPLSDAMVDLRATFEQAVAEQVIDAALGAELIARAKATHYVRRSFAAVLAAAERAAAERAAAGASQPAAAERAAAGASQPAAQLAQLRAWLPAHRVAQKQLDALALLRTLRKLLEADELTPFEPSFRFEHTDAWEQLARRSGHRQTTSSLDPRITGPLLDELRLAARGTYAAAIDGALARALATTEARRDELVVDEVLLGEAANSFFLHRGTLSPEAIAAWMAAEQLDAESLARFLEREARLHWARTQHAAELLVHLPDQLRATGALLPLLRRAREKQRLLAQLGGAQMLTVDEAEGAALLDWFFRQRWGQPPPGNADACAQVLGFESGERLLRALMLERRLADSVAGRG